MDPGGRDVDRDFCKWKRQQERNNNLFICFILFMPPAWHQFSGYMCPITAFSSCVLLFFSLLMMLNKPSIVKPQL